MVKVTIRYQYGTYSGTRVLFVNEDVSDQEAKVRMWAEMRRRGELGLPMAHQSAEVVSREMVE